MSIDSVDNEIKNILAENKLKMACEIVFPKYKELPEEVKLCLHILNKHGMKIVISIESQK